MFSLTGKSQHAADNIGVYIERIIENTVASTEGSIDITSIVSDLEALSIMPLNLNSASADEFDKLWILNDFQIKSLLEYREKMGQILSLSELNYIYGFTNETTILISPFVYIGPAEQRFSNASEKFWKATRHEIVLRSSQRAIKSNEFIPLNHTYFLRYKGWNDGKLYWGLIAEKDRGEDFFKASNPYGFDFYSGYMQYKGNRFVRNVIIGDYRVRAGQGLLIWPGYSSGKSSQVTSAQKRGQGIKGNSSSDEYNFFRGGIISMGSGKFTMNAFASSKRIDATVDTIKKGITTIRTDGLHRTSTEIEYEKNTQENLVGLQAQYRGQHLSVGANYLGINYSLPLLESENVYQAKIFRVFG
jgi:hypothetical protein